MEKINGFYGQNSMYKILPSESVFVFYCTIK